MAYRYPRRKVLCSDMTQRDAFENYLDAFNSKGSRHSLSDTCNSAVMANVTFLEADMSEVAEKIDSNTCVMVIHGCNEVGLLLPYLE